MPDTVSYNRNKVHNLDMAGTELDRLFAKCEKALIKENPRACRNVGYLEELQNEISARSQKLGEEVVLGIWVRPYGGPSHIAGYSWHAKSDADKMVQISKMYENSVDPFFGGYFDIKWIKEKIDDLNQRYICPKI